MTADSGPQGRCQNQRNRRHDVEPSSSMKRASICVPETGTIGTMVVSCLGDLTS